MSVNLANVFVRRLQGKGGNIFSVPLSRLFVTYVNATNVLQKYKNFKSDTFFICFFCIKIQKIFLVNVMIVDNQMFM